MNQFIINILQKVAAWIRLNGLIFSVAGIFTAFSEKASLKAIPMTLFLIYSIILFPKCFKFISSKVARIITIGLYPLAFLGALGLSTTYSESPFYILLYFNGLLLVIMLYRILRFIVREVNSIIPGATNHVTHSKPRTKSVWSVINQQQTAKQPVTSHKKREEVSHKIVSTAPKTQNQEKQPGRREEAKIKQTFYCVYCGHSSHSVQGLVTRFCPMHPNGFDKGNHKLYEGTEKEFYNCKYCGKKFSSIFQMVQQPRCMQRSDKGKHEPTL